MEEVQGEVGVDEAENGEELPPAPIGLLHAKDNWIKMQSEGTYAGGGVPDATEP